MKVQNVKIIVEGEYYLSYILELILIDLLPYTLLNLTQITNFLS